MPTQYRRKGRVVSCQECGKGYHDRHDIPRVANTCNICGGHTFVRREDDADAEHMVNVRLENYRNRTMGVITYYKATNGLVTRLDATRSISEVGDTVAETIKRIGR